MVLPIDIVLVRHGESEGSLAMQRGRNGDRSVFLNENFRKKHSSLFRLTDGGIEQAKAAGEWIRKNVGQIDHFLVSEYIRAMETAGYLNIPFAQWQVDFMLRERDWGAHEHKTYEERRKIKEKVERQHQEFFYVPKRGESMAQMCLRLSKILSDLHNLSDRRVLIVCHDKVIKGFRVLLENISQEKYREISKGFRDPTSKNHIRNGQIFHYTRRDPYAYTLHPRLKYMRSVVPTDDTLACNTGWVKVQDTRNRLSNEELIRIAQTVPRIINNDSPQVLPLGYSRDNFEIPKHFEKEISDVEEEEDDDDKKSEEEEGTKKMMKEGTIGEKEDDIKNDITFTGDEIDGEEEEEEDVIIMRSEESEDYQNKTPKKKKKKKKRIVRFRMDSTVLDDLTEKVMKKAKNRKKKEKKKVKKIFRS